jgi:CSLREA domain-containing protein
VGNFVWDRENRSEIGLLDASGTIRILERGTLDKRVFTTAEYKRRPLELRRLMAEEEARRNLNYKPRHERTPLEKWTEVDGIQVAAPLDSVAASSPAYFTSARMTPFGTEDLLVLDPANRKLQVLVSNNDELKKSNESYALSSSGEHALVTFDVEGATPVAALPMRLNIMNRPGIVLLNEESSEPTLAPAAPVATYNVTKAADTYGPACTAGEDSDCSFREALRAANAANDSDLINIPANLTITINQALGDPDSDTSVDLGAQQSGDWDVFYDTTIAGADQATTILQAALPPPPAPAPAPLGYDRVLHAFQATLGVPDLTLSNLTIRNGRCRVDFPIPVGLNDYECVDGGGLNYAVDNQSVLTISNSTITNNRTDVETANPANNGGGIFAGQSDINLTNVTVSNNTTAFVSSGCTGATQCGGEGGGMFGGIRFSANPTAVIITNSTFTGNTANSNAGLGGRGGAYAGSPDSVSISGGTFSSNIATTDGGAFRLFTPTTITNGPTISNNSARQNGGAIWSDPLANDNTPQTNTFTGVIMRGNTADSDGVIATNNVNRGDGGAIFHGRGTLHLNNPTIGGTGAGEANTAYDGGGIARTYSPFTSAIFNASTLNINNGGSIVGNQAINNGGGIINDATKTAAAGNASALNMTGATAVTFTDNKSRNHGGGIAVITNAGSTTPAASATLNNMTLRSNQADSDNSGGGDGGALYQGSVVTGGGTTLTGATIIGGSGFANTAVNGGGVANAAGTLTIPASTQITFNTATGTGGGISNAGTLSALATPTITNNTATGNGGGIHNTGTLGAITLPTLSGNSAATGGGLFSSNGTLSITNGGISSNVATTGKGGGIEHSGASDSTVTGVVITNNTGSGIHITGTGSLDAANNIITGNSGDGITKIGSGVGSHFNSNTVHTNGELGIDLVDDGVTLNDTNDTDTGPNNRQNFPVLNYVRRGDGVANVTLNAPNGTYRIQYYKNAACDASLHGEGEVLMASQTVDITSVATQTFFSPALPFDSGVREQITATATHSADGDADFDDDGSTSEFSACRKVNTLPIFTAVQTPSRQKGSPVSNSQIATVTDPDQTLNTLVVTVNGGASATVNGVTVSNIVVDASGNVTANIVASCTATNAGFTLRVTDNATEFNETTLNVTVTPNTPPTLGTYPNTTVNTGSSGTVVTPNAAPTDNGTVATLTATAPGFTGTFVGNPTTGTVTVNNAGPFGVYTVTVTATDNCTAATTTTFQLTVNAIPTITGATISRQKGSPATNSQIATVNDNDQTENTLVVTVNGGATASANGVTVSNIVVSAVGNVTADIVADCSAVANTNFTLTVTDSVGASSNATLTVNVTPNTPPSVGTYANTSLTSGGGTTVTPSAAPADNGSIASATAAASGAFTGTLSVNPTTGVVTISNANPGGSYTITVTFTDNCVATTSPTFTLNVTYSISGTVNYNTTTPANPTVKPVPNVVISATIASSVSTNTNSAGAYTLNNLIANGHYLVTPTKVGDANGITPFDATLVLRHVAANGVGANALSANQQLAADTNNSGTITPFDATQILRYVAAGMQNGTTGQVADWKFVPPSRDYPSLTSSLTNENYQAILIGEVDGSWTPPGMFAFASGKIEAAKQQSPTDAVVRELEESIRLLSAHTNAADALQQEKFESESGKSKKPLTDGAAEVQVSLPTNAAAVAGSVVTVPVLLTNTANKEISAYSFAVRFDSSMLQPENSPIDKTGTLSGNGFTVVSDTDTAGRIGIAALSLNGTVSTSGTLLYLRFKVIGAMSDSKDAETTALTFETTAQSNGIFEGKFGDNPSSAAANGFFTRLRNVSNR